jgi:putative membrane protein insertion efficiency factor
MITKGMIAIVKAYRLLISPWVGPCCRFSPSCSLYCMDALKRFGLWRGLRLSLFRVLRCHPWHPGGYDPVPSTVSFRHE